MHNYNLIDTVSPTNIYMFFVLRFTVVVVGVPGQFIIYFRITSPEQLYDLPNAIEVTLKDMDKFHQYKTTTKHNKMQTMCLNLAMYYTSIPGESIRNIFYTFHNTTAVVT